MNLFHNRLIRKILVYMILVTLLVFVGCGKNNKVYQVDNSEDAVRVSQDNPIEDEAQDNEAQDNEAQDKAEQDKAEQEDIFANLIVPAECELQKRFLVPQGYTRVEYPKESFETFLQTLPLKEAGERVHYYDGGIKSANVYLAVVDYDLRAKDLQQCADSIMRLRAEYLYKQGRKEDIQFHFVNGFLADFETWSKGNSIQIDGNQVSFVPNSSCNDSYESLQDYLDVVYMYASTLSLEKELVSKDLDDVKVGDVFIKGGSPGHCVIVVDLAIHNETKEKIVMLAQGYMPAQDIQILVGDSENSPWFSMNIEENLITPEWVFQTSQLRTFE